MYHSRARDALRRRSSRRRGTASGTPPSSRSRSRRFDPWDSFPVGSVLVRAAARSGRCCAGELPGDERAEREAGGRHADEVAGQRRGLAEDGLQVVVPPRRRSTCAPRARRRGRHHADGDRGVAGGALPDRRVARAAAPRRREGQPPPMMNVPFAACFSVSRRPMCCTSGSSTLRRGSVTFTCSPSARIGSAARSSPRARPPRRRPR